MRSKVIIIAVTLLLIASSINAEILYNVIDLGTLGGSRSYAYSINNNGQVVGMAFNHDNSYPGAVLFDATGDGENMFLGEGIAMSINGNGQIVGKLDKKVPSGPYATIFDPAGTFNNIELGEESTAFYNNNNGQIVGFVTLHEEGEIPVERAALFDTDNPGSSIALGTLGEHRGSIAYSVNNSGNIVGVSHNDYFSGDFRATLFDQTGGGNSIDLGALGGPFSMALSINDEGQIVGSGTIPSHYERATLFDSTGTGNNISLGTLGELDYTIASSINNKGEIVGKAGDYRSTYSYAVFFDSSGQGNNIDLNNIIDPSLGWQLLHATCINDNSWIAGYGINPEGYERAFLLTPVSEPMTVLLVGFGAVMLRRKSRGVSKR